MWEISYSNTLNEQYLTLAVLVSAHAFFCYSLIRFEACKSVHLKNVGCRTSSLNIHAKILTLLKIYENKAIAKK